MNRKLSVKARKGILIAIFVILALVAVYYVFWGRKQQSPVTPDASTLEIVDTERASSTEIPEESEESEEVTEPSSETETPEETLPPQTDPPGFWDDLTATETLPPQTDPPGFWDDLTATEPPVIIVPTEPATEPAPSGDTVTLNGITVTRGEQYHDKDHVALYLHTFRTLPPNYITKSEADSIRNWQSKGYYIGGDRFGNREGALPKKNGRQYYECDISYTSSSNRGTRRIVYSNDGLIYYTGDHYKTFTQLY